MATFSLASRGMEIKTTAAPSTRFVSPLSEYDQGKALYKAGKPIRECVTDDMAAGWMDSNDDGADAYWQAMMQASAQGVM